MARRVSTWQKAGIMIVAVCLGWGAWQLYLWREWNGRFRHWQTDVPLRLRLAAGLDGAYAAEFTQTCAIAHAQRLILEPVDAMDQPRMLAAARSVHVSGFVEALDRDPAWKVDLLEWEPADSEFGVVTARISPPPPNGRCRLRFAVKGGAAEEGLGAVDLVMRNELCGLEAMPGLVHAGLGILALVVGGVLGLVVAATLAGGRSGPEQTTPWQPP